MTTMTFSKHLYGSRTCGPIAVNEVQRVSAGHGEDF